MADLLSYVAARGQTPGEQVGQLPAGHAPLPTNLVAQVARGPHGRARRVGRTRGDDPTAERRTRHRTPTDRAERHRPRSGCRRSRADGPRDPHPTGRSPDAERRPDRRRDRRGEAGPIMLSVGQQSAGNRCCCSRCSVARPCSPWWPARCCSGWAGRTGAASGCVGDRGARPRPPPATPAAPARATPRPRRPATREASGAPRGRCSACWWSPGWSLAFGAYLFVRPALAADRTRTCSTTSSGRPGTGHRAGGRRRSRPARRSGSSRSRTSGSSRCSSRAAPRSRRCRTGPQARLRAARPGRRLRPGRPTGDLRRAVPRPRPAPAR